MVVVRGCGGSAATVSMSGRLTSTIAENNISTLDKKARRAQIVKGKIAQKSSDGKQGII